MIQSLFLIFVGLQCADYLTTKLIIEKGGSELNPVVGFFINHLGLNIGLIVVKLVAILLFTYIISIHFYGVEFIASLICILYGIVVYHNIKEMK